MEKTVEEIKKELERAYKSRVKAMIAIFKLREESDKQYFGRRRGRMRSEEELRKLAESCRLNWKLMEEAGIVQCNNGEIIVRI